LARQTFSLNGLNGITSVTPWLTDIGNGLVQQTAVAVSGNSFTYSMPVSSVVSFVGVNNVGPTATPTRTLSPTYTPTPVVSSNWRVNAGGPSYTDTVGNTWAADENYSGGTTVASGGAVTGTSDSTLYDTQRYGSSFSYSFNVPAGSYQVTLKFAETYSGDYSTGPAFSTCHQWGHADRRTWISTRRWALTRRTTRCTTTCHPAGE
jgi:hypothetical protein